MWRNAKVCEDVGIALAHDNRMANDKDMKFDILPAKSTEVPAQVRMLFKLARNGFMNI